MRAQNGPRGRKRGSHPSLSVELARIEAQEAARRVGMSQADAREYADQVARYVERERAFAAQRVA